MSGDKPPFLVFGAPDIGQDEIDELVACVRSGWIGTGPRVAEFERRFADYRSAQAAQATSSCTAALHLGLLGSNIGPGDEVVTTPLTFVATINVIIHTGATPVLADVDPNTMNIDPQRIADACTERTRAILPVHFAGRPCDMGAIMGIAGDRNLRVIEDCAHAIETTIDDKPAGTFGDFGCFSFYTTKNLVTGEGGMLLARDVEALKRIKALSLHGMSRDAWARFGSKGYSHYQLVEPGYKYNMTDMCAALGLHQLAKIEHNWRRRESIWNRYNAAFADLPVTRPAATRAGARHAYHLYTLLVDAETAGIERDEFLQRMQAQGVGVGVHYVSAVEQEYYRTRFGWTPGDCPNAYAIGRQTVSLPMSPGLRDEDVERVVGAVHACLA